MFDHKTFLRNVGAAPGIYQMFDEVGELLYVGKAKNLRKRLSSCLLYTSPSPRDRQKSRMPSSA